jgi:hypothetical protein
MTDGPPFVLNSFVPQLQAQILTQCKESLNGHEYVVLVDFAENCSFVVQDAAQECHWSNDQRTFHPIVIYVHWPESPSKSNSVSLCIACYCMAHVTSKF